MGRHLVELFPVDDAQGLQVPQGVGEHGAGDPRNGPFQGAEAADGRFGQHVEDVQTPLPAEQFQGPPHGAVLLDGLVEDPVPIGLWGQVLLHGCVPPLVRWSRLGIRNLRTCLWRWSIV